MTLASGVIWTAIYLATPHGGFDPAEWLILMVFAIIPIPPLTLFLYARFRRGTPFVPSPRRLFLAAIIMLALCAAWIGEYYLGKKHDNMNFVWAGAYLIVAAINLRVALRARASASPHP